MFHEITLIVIGVASGIVGTVYGIKAYYRTKKPEYAYEQQKKTEEEIMKSVEYAKRAVDAGAKYCSFFIPIPFPGSQLYNYAISHGHLFPDFDPDSMNWHKPVMKNTVVSPERILELREWAWRTVNRQEYVAERLKQNIGNRWNPNQISG